MEVGEDRLANIDGLVTRLLGHAVMARAYGEAIRRDPALAGGFGKLAERHCTAVRTLCGEIEGAATDLTGMRAVAVPFVAAG